MNPNRLDPITVLLATLVLILVVLLLIQAHIHPNDGQTFQVLASLLSGFAGALLARVKPQGANHDDAAPLPLTLPIPPSGETK